MVAGRSSRRGLRAVVAGLSSGELSAAWRKSAASLTAGRDSATTVEVVATRAVLLDELERRDPAAMRQWIAAGADPAGPPSYLLGFRSMSSRER